jgi:hypothetical protein
MLGADAFEARNVLVDARIVFHGAGTQRVHAQINSVIPGGKPREVANDFDFADFGEALDIAARVIGSERRLHVDRRHVGGRQFEAALSGR